jgi:predicted XRE-type DNA-binding protein
MTMPDLPNAQPGSPGGDGEATKHALADAITAVIRQRKLTLRDAERVCGMSSAKLSLICHHKLKGFSIERLMRVLGGFGFSIAITATAAPTAERGKLTFQLSALDQESEHGATPPS